VADVHHQFGNEDFRGASGDAVDGIQPREFLRERDDDGRDPLIQGPTRYSIRI
jgi:hypothetical protein